MKKALKLTQSWLDEYRPTKELESFINSRTYDSNTDAKNALLLKAEIHKKLKVMKKQGGMLDYGDAVRIILDTLALTLIPANGGKTTVAIYNYDKKIYDLSEDYLNELLTCILEKSSHNMLKSAMLTLQGMKHDANLIPYKPLPAFKIAVGNGIYNCITRELEPYTPGYTILTKIATNYYPNAPVPIYAKHIPFDKLVADLSNNNKDREELLYQICKTIIFDETIVQRMFIVLGEGGDGKSTFFQLIANIIGNENTAYFSLKDLSSEHKVLLGLNKKLALGLDNDARTYVKEMQLIKSMATNENITLDRKFLDSISFPWTATIVQICNTMPRFDETGPSLERRLEIFHAKNSHYVKQTENKDLSGIIKSKEYQEHALSMILDETHVPYFNNYNQVDKHLLELSLDVENTLKMFYDEMYQIDLFSDMNKQIPVYHLYAAYRDYMATVSVGNRPLSMRSFQTQSTEIMRKMGYKLDTSTTYVRPSTLEANNLYDPNSFVDLVEEYYLAEAIQKDHQGRVFTKFGEAKLPKRKEVNVRALSVFEFFNIKNKLLHYFETRWNDTTVMKANTVKLASNLTERDLDFLEQLENYVSGKAKSLESGVVAKSAKPIIEDIMRPVQLGDPKLLFDNNDIEGFKKHITEFKAWDLSLPSILTIFTRELNLLKQIAMRLHDPLLTGLEMQARNEPKEQQHLTIINILENILDIMEKQKK